MAKTYDLLTESQWTGALLEDVLKSELVSIVGRTDVTYQATGPSVMLAAREVLALGLVFHELTTNGRCRGRGRRISGPPSRASKLAWKSPSEAAFRVVRIAWDVADTSSGRLLKLAWTEDFAEPAESPGKSGFGSRLIDMAIMRELEGRVERDFEPNRLRIKIELPLSAPPGA